jgi:hypothetical protein
MQLSGRKPLARPLGNDALRVLARYMNDPELTDWALLPPENQAQANIEIDAENNCATVTMGRITAVVKLMLDRHQRITVTYYNQRGEVLLAEREGTDALKIAPRTLKGINGGDYS